MDDTTEKRKREEKNKVMHARIPGKVSKDSETRRTADSKEREKPKVDT